MAVLAYCTGSARDKSGDEVFKSSADEACRRGKACSDQGVNVSSVVLLGHFHGVSTWEQHLPPFPQELCLPGQRHELLPTLRGRGLQGKGGDNSKSRHDLNSVADLRAAKTSSCGGKGWYHDREVSLGARGNFNPCARPCFAFECLCSSWQSKAFSGPTLISQAPIQEFASVFCALHCAREEPSNHRVSWGRGCER